MARPTLRIRLATSFYVLGLAIALAAFAGCVESQASRGGKANGDDKKVDAVTSIASEAPTADEVARTYTDLKLITGEPVLVDPQLAFLCVGVYQRHIDEARKRSGPHAYTSIRIFMNDVAAAAFERDAKAYPVGSVIVKEKQGQRYFADEDRSLQNPKTPDGVGGMIKRSPGYDPNNSDWEYFYFEDPDNLEHGKIAACVDCHRGAALSDFVFGDWAEQLDTLRRATER
jgi:hypothetical protein